jgi:hypothetical protein
VHKSARFIIAAGGYRTGSTLQYNLCGTYVEQLGVGRRLGSIDPDGVDAMLAEHGSSADFVGVAKSHHAVDGFGRFATPTRWADLVLDGTATPIMSVRDLASQRRSMMRKFRLAEAELESSIFWREDEANTRRWTELGAFEQTYEELTQRPLEAIRQLAAHIGLAWDPDAAAETSRLSAIDRVWESLPAIERGTYDPITLVHWDHISDKTLAELDRRA